MRFHCPSDVPELLTDVDHFRDVQKDHTSDLSPPENLLIQHATTETKTSGTSKISAVCSSCGEPSYKVQGHLTYDCGNDLEIAMQAGFPNGRNVLK